MDTTTLVVGQDVYVVSQRDHFSCQGRVTKVAPEGVEVLVVPTLYRLHALARIYYDVDAMSWVVPMRFDNEGNGEPDGQDVYGFSPWRIDNIPFAERRRLSLHRTREEDYRDCVY